MHNGCILCGGVGVGKSHTAVMYYLLHEAPKNVYVITTAKKRDKLDWQELFLEVGMSDNPELTMGAELKVDSWENIKKYEEVTDAFFIFDEQRLVGTGVWVKAFYKIAAANRWVMLSATPGDNWLDYVPVFRANGFIKNITQFKEDHVISRWTGRYYQVTGYRQVSKLVRWRNQLLIDMPYEKHTKRHTHYVDVQYDKDLVKDLVKRRWHVYEDRPLTDASELFRVTRQVVYSDASRLEAVRGLLKTHPKLIVFYNFNYELELLRTLQTTGTTIVESESSSDTTTRSSSTSDSPASESSNTSTLNTSASTKSPTPSGTESITQSSTFTPTKDPKNSTEISVSDWDYLLSEQGLRANEMTWDSPSLKSRLLDQTVRPLMEGHWTKDNGKGEVWIPATCPTKEKMISSNTFLPRTRTDSQETSESISTDRLKSLTPQQTRGIGVSGARGQKMEHSSTSTSSAEAGAVWTAPREDLDGATENTSPAETPETGETVRMSSPDSSLEHADGASQNSEGSLGTSCMSEDSSLDPTGNSTRPPSQPKEPECKTNPSLTSSTNSSTDSEDESSTRSESRTTTRLAGFPKSSSSKKSLDSFKVPQDSLILGSSSTSPQQFQVAEWNGHKHEDVPTTTSWVYLVQYVAGAEAWECTDTDAMVFFSQPYSYKIWWQAHGRIDRLNTPFMDLHYYILWADSHLEKNNRESLEHKKSFNESAFAHEMWDSGVF